MTRIQLAVWSDGQQTSCEVDATMVGALAVHAAHPGVAFPGYRITHPSSGMALAVGFPDAQAACAAASEINALYDWRRTRVELVPVGRALLARCRPIVALPVLFLEAGR
jgi:hypothetical protein